MDAHQLQNHAEAALAAMRAAGFDDARVTAAHGKLDELNIALSEPSLLRSTDSLRLSLAGIVDGRMASTDLTDFSPDAVRSAAAALFEDAKAAPQDEANGVSANQHARIVQGPQEPDRELLADKVAEMLAFRERETPRMMIDEGVAKHQWSRSHTLTTRGSDLAASIGCYALEAFGTARDGDKSSSFNYTGGTAHDLRARPAQEFFGIADMLRDTERMIETKPLPGKFTGDVIFAPNAVAALLGWLMGQLSDQQLIAKSSLFAGSVGESIAAPSFTLRSRFDAPGVAAISADGFSTPAVTLVERGVLKALTPTLYGSRKTGIAHVPVAGGGWELAAGDTPLASMISGVQRGALVGRLSMGNPASNGDFSSVIKNSFLIEGGETRGALAETMIAGNIAHVLKGIVAVSREVIDGGSTSLPWLRVNGLHFS